MVCGVYHILVLSDGFLAGIFYLFQGYLSYLKLRTGSKCSTRFRLNLFGKNASLECHLFIPLFLVFSGA